MPTSQHREQQRRHRDLLVNVVLQFKIPVALLCIGETNRRDIPLLDYEQNDEVYPGTLRAQRGVDA
jgi:hypothetical protein